MNTRLLTRSIRQFVLATSICALVPAASAATAVWNGGFGNWSNTSLWNSAPACFFPNNGNNGEDWTASINSGAVAVDQLITIDFLNFDGGTIVRSSALTVNDGFNWTGGELDGNSALTLGAGSVSTMSGGFGKLLKNGTMNIVGTLTWTGGGALDVRDTTLTVENGGLFDMQNNSAIGDNGSNGISGSVVVASGGILRKSTGTGTSTIGGFGDAVTLTVQTGGTVQVQSGVLSLNGGGSVVGTLEVSNGARLELNSGITFNTGATINSSGSGAVRNIQTMAMAGATGVNGILEMAGGTLTGAGTLTVNSGGRIEWTAGEMTGAGVTQIASGGLLNMSGGFGKILTNRALNIGGILTWTDAGALDVRDTTLTVENGGLFDMQNNSAIGDNGNNGTNGSVVVASGGILRKSAGTGTSTIGAFGDPVTLTVQNGGTVQAWHGTLDIKGSVSLAGTLEVLSGSNVTFTSPATVVANSGSVTVDGAGSTLTVAGTYAQTSGGALLSNGGQFVAPAITLTGGTITANGGPTGGVLSVTAGGAGLIFGGTSSPVITLDSSNSVAGRILLSNNVTVDNTLTSGTAQILSGGSGSNPGRIDMNGGTRTWSVNNGSAAVDLLVSASLQNGALTKAGAGTLALTGANTFTGATTISASGGTLEAAAANALGGTSSVIVNSGGTLLLSGSGDRVNDAAGFTLAGGTFNTGGLSETVGALTLTASSIVDFGAGSSFLTFADSQSANWGNFRLSIYNWSGITQTGGGVDQLRFANNGLTPGQLSQIDFYSDGGISKLSITPAFYANGFVGGFGEVTPVPEPSAVAVALGLLGLVGWRERRKAAASRRAGRFAEA